MEKNVLSAMEGVDLYGIISICLFFGFFIAMLVWAARLKTTYINSMQELTLEDASIGCPPSRASSDADRANARPCVLPGAAGATNSSPNSEPGRPLTSSNL